ncbi:MAG: hypothetical protein NUV31_08490, partial [Dehalococcoidales bacterium]|nr:hypothetical protein [Dehalococcoidales bacterium]
MVGEAMLIKSEKIYRSVIYFFKKKALHKLVAMILIVVIFLIVACKPEVNDFNMNNTLSFPPPLGTETIKINKEWGNSVEQLLDACYMEYPDHAGFCDAGSEVLLPDLYTTYAALGILSLCGQEIDEKENIIQWINSLNNGKGGYIDPNNSADDLVQTYWAAASLAFLGSKLSDSEGLMIYIKEHQKSNKFFFYGGDNNSGNSLIHDLPPTFHAIEILRLSGLLSHDIIEEFELNEIVSKINQYVTEQITADGSGLT